MDITLLRTFLEVAATGSFVNASERLFVTQSAVSLRIQRLEDSLGRPLFTRSKAGAELTPAGLAFERYAASMIKVWEEARQQVAIPEGFTRTLTIGAQYSLWPRLGFRWIDALRADLPDLNIRGELGMPDRVTRFLVEGIVQVGLLYTPQLRPGLRLEKVVNEELVMVSSWDTTIDEIGDRYVYVDWGPEFLHAHAADLPGFTNRGLTMALGALSGEFIVNRKAACYLPARAAKRYLDQGRLFLVPDTPVFPYPVWSVWRTDLDPDLEAVAEKALERVIDDADRTTGEVLESLRGLNEDKEISTLGSSEQ